MKSFIYMLLLLIPASYLQAAEIAVTMHALGNDGPKHSIGVIVVKETAQGLQFQPHLRNMEPGNYTFSINENVGCGSQYTTTGANIPGMAAGKSINQLPAIAVSSDGVADQSVTASKLGMRDVRGRTLVISQGGSQNRIACGTLELYR